jgi:hypothetical protein
MSFILSPIVFDLDKQKYRRSKCIQNYNVCNLLHVFLGRDKGDLTAVYDPSRSKTRRENTENTEERKIFLTAKTQRTKGHEGENLAFPSWGLGMRK